MKQKINIGDALDSYLFRFEFEKEDWAVIIMVKNSSIIGFFTGNLEETPNVGSKTFECCVEKHKDPNGKSRFDLVVWDKHGYKTIMEGISRSFRNDFTNYSRDISEKLAENLSESELQKNIDSYVLSSDQEIWRQSLKDGIKKVNELLKQKNIQYELELVC